MRERAIRPYDGGWQAADLERDQRWIYHSSQTERDRLIDLAKTIEARCDGNPNRLLAMGADDFDLGPLAARLVEMMGEIRDGAGLALYRGLPLDEVSPLGAAALYWGIGLHLGTPKSNNPEGDMIGHVVNTGGNYDNPNQRGYQTNVEMDYHCDQSDVVGLLCIRPAMTGGLSKVVSSRAVHATIKSRRPDLEAVLSQPFCWTKHAETDSGEAPFYESPVFNFVGDTLSTSFGPKHMIKGHRLAEAPDLTPLQAEAIDVMSELADEMHLSMDLQRGDIQLVNNYKILHTRTGFDDWPEPGRQRTLWRLWLTVDDFLPRTPYSEQWLGGVAPAGTEPRITLDYLARTTD